MKSNAVQSNSRWEWGPVGSYFTNFDAGAWDYGKILEWLGSIILLV